MSAAEQAARRRRLPAPGRAAARARDAADLHRRAPGQPRRAAGHLPARGARPPTRRWPTPRAPSRRAGGCTRRSRSRCAATATSTPPRRSAPTSSCRCSDARSARAPRSRGRAGGGSASAPLERTLRAHRRAVREHLAHVDALRAELEAEGMATRLLDGAEVMALLWARFNPTTADRGRAPAPESTAEVLGELDAVRERERGAPRRRAPEGGDRALEPRLPRLAPARRGRRGPRADDPRPHHRRAHADGLAARRDADPPAVHAQRLRPRARPPPRAPAAQARLPAPVHDQPRRRAARPRARLRPLRPGARVRGPAGRAGRRRAGRHLPRRDLPDAARPRPDAGRRPRSREAVDYCAEQIEAVGDCKVARGEFRQHELWPSERCRSAATSTAARASTRPPTPATWSRWSARSAARRPASRSPSPTPAAPSSCSTPTTPSTPTTRW